MSARVRIEDLDIPATQRAFRVTILKYRIAGARFHRVYADGDAAQIRAAVLVENGVPVVVKTKRVTRATWEMALRGPGEPVHIAGEKNL